MDKINLLLVENAEEETLQVAEYLGGIYSLNIDIHFCQNLGESYELIGKEQIDIILLNLFLPDGYGLQSYTSLFSELPDIPCIVLTELDDSYIAAEAVKNGAQDYIPKEKMNSEILFRSITYAIERKQFEKELRKSEILRELDKRVKTALNQNSMNDKNSEDGMKLGLIHIDYTQNKLEFAGAMRPLYLVRNGELEIFKGSKFSIGGVSLRNKEFTTIYIDIQKGDSIYLLSDGYPDQFGRPNGKKFMKRSAGDILLNIAHLPMNKQNNIIKQNIKRWMKNEEQVDVILICGIKF